MIKKKILTNPIYEKKNYEKVVYTGSSGILFKINHFLMSMNIKNSYNAHIIEIGGGAKPHIEFMKDTKDINSYTLIDNKIFKNQIKILKKKYPLIKFKFIDYRKKNLKNFYKKFTRLVSSHCFEHVTNFEDEFIKYLNLMKKDSLISIALPCDPGVIWRILQYISYFKQKKIYRWKNFKEKDLDDARDHVTPVQNIIKVIKFYFKKINFIYFPFLLPVIWLNIFIIAQIKIKDFDYDL